MTEGTLIFRPNLSQLTWKRETDFNEQPTNAVMVTPLGIIDEEVRLPDPEINFFAHRNIGEGADISIVAPGARTLTGSIPLIPQNGKILAMMLGAVADTGTDQPTAGGGSTLNGATVVGATTVILTAATDYSVNDYIQIDVGVNAEVRKITVVSTNTLTLDKKLLIAHANLAVCNEVIAPYTHAITGAAILPSMCLEAVYNDGTDDFIRYFRGVKISGGTLSAAEEDKLKVTLDIEAAYAQAHATNTKSVLVPVTTLPYIYHQGTCKFWGTTFARVLDWSINVKRTLNSRRYIASTPADWIASTGYVVGDQVKPTSTYLNGYYYECTVAGTTAASPEPTWPIPIGQTVVDGTATWSCKGVEPIGGYAYEINEGNRDVELTATLIAANDTGSGTNATEAMLELLSPTAAGFDIELVHTRGTNDTVTISNPTAKKCHLRTAPHPLNMGEDYPVSISVLMKGIELSIVDAIPFYPVV